MKKLVVLLCLISACAIAPAQEAAKLSRDVTVSGAVRNPGVVTLSEKKWGLVEAIIKVGGPTREADMRHVTVRFKAGGETVYDLEAVYRKTEKNPQLSDGDVVVVRKLNGEEPNQSLQPTALLGRG